MAVEGGRIDFMFLAPLTRPVDPLLLLDRGAKPLIDLNSFPHYVQFIM